MAKGNDPNGKPYFELPTNAKDGSDGDHYRIDRIEENPADDGDIVARVTYGTEDSNGNWVTRTNADGTDDTAPIRIGDRASFDSSGFSGNSPSAKGDPPSQLHDAVNQFAADNSLFPTS